MTEKRATWTKGAHHVGLTVPDAVSAGRSFEDALGFEEVGTQPEYPAIFLSDGSIMITLWQARDPEHATAFDRHQNLGLHHLALRVGAGRLDALHRQLRERPDVAIEFGPEDLGAGPARHLMSRIPGNLRVEFIEVPS